MKQAFVMGILTALFMTVLTACGNSAESNHSQEVQDMTSNTMDAEYEEEHTGGTEVSDLFTGHADQRLLNNDVIIRKSISYKFIKENENEQLYL